MSKSSEFVSSLCKSRNESIIGGKYYPDTNYGNMMIAVSRLSDKDIEDDTIELEDENFMYIKVALINKVIDEKEGTT